jgi:hypothetical protein
LKVTIIPPPLQRQSPSANRKATVSLFIEHEKRIDLIASKDVIEGFGNWLYRRRLDGNAPWQFWIDLYIFSCEYLITELSLDVLNEMLSKSEREPWIPDSEQIRDIYEHTAEGSSLRLLAVVCFSDNTENDRKTILQAADEAFVRDYAIYASSVSEDQLEIIKEHCGYPLDKRFAGSPVALKGSISFRVQDTDEMGIIHSSIICSGSDFEGSLCSTSYAACNSCTTTNKAFRCFASWLYFNDDLCWENDDCQVSPDLTYLLDCYEMSLSLLACEVNATADGDIDLDEKQFREKLRWQAKRYKHCLLKAIQTHCERREDTPSVDEIARIYTITDSGDPLRSLMGDVFTSRGKSRITDMVHVEFQRELNASILEELSELRLYANQVELVQNDIKKLEPNAAFHMDKQRKKLKQKTQELIELKPPASRQPDAARYHNEELCSN